MENQTQDRFRVGGNLIRSPVTFSKNEKAFFCCSGSVVKTYSVATGALIGVLEGHTARVSSILINPENDLQVFTTSHDGTIRKWDYAESTCLSVYNLGMPILHGVISRDTIYLNADPGYYSRTIELLNNNQEQHQHTGQEVTINNPQVQKDRGCRVIAFRLHQQDTTTLFSARNCTSLAINPANTYLATIANTELTVYSLAKRFALRFGHVRRLMTVSFHPTHHVLATGDNEGHIVLWHSFDQAFQAAVRIGMPGSVGGSGPLLITSADSGSSGGRFVSAPTTLSSISGQSQEQQQTQQQQQVQQQQQQQQQQQVQQPRFRIPTSNLHWHSHGVTATAFSEDGSYLLSGGEEAVLVYWQLETGQKTFLPRLGGPLMHITVSPKGTLYALACADNAVRMVSAINNKIRQHIQGLQHATAHLLTRDDKYRLGGSAALAAYEHIRIDRNVRTSPLRSPSLLETGLHVDARSRCIILSGTQGSVQFFDVFSDKHVATLTAVERTAVSRAEDASISVEHAIISPCGTWLATVDVLTLTGHGSSHVPSFESLSSSSMHTSSTSSLSSSSSPTPKGRVSLKFWRRGSPPQSIGGISGAHYSSSCLYPNFYLCSRADSPHDGSITSIAFHPRLPQVVTTSSDGTFKIWAATASSTNTLTSYKAQLVKRNLLHGNTKRGFIAQQRAKAKQGSGDGAGVDVVEANLDDRIWTWSNVGQGDYRPCQAKSVSYSSDGSLLAVVYDHVVTIWALTEAMQPSSSLSSLSSPSSRSSPSSPSSPSSSTTLNAYTNGTLVGVSATLCHTFVHPGARSEPIRWASFLPNSLVFVTLSSTSLYVWDLLTLSVRWSYSLEAVAFATHPTEPYFAIMVQLPFSKDTTLAISSSSTSVSPRLPSSSSSSPSSSSPSSAPLSPSDAAATGQGKPTSETKLGKKRQRETEESDSRLHSDNFAKSLMVPTGALPSSSHTNTFIVVFSGSSPSPLSLVSASDAQIDVSIVDNTDITDSQLNNLLASLSPTSPASPVLAPSSSSPSSSSPSSSSPPSSSSSLLLSSSSSSSSSSTLSSSSSAQVVTTPSTHDHSDHNYPGLKRQYTGAITFLVNNSSVPISSQQVTSSSTSIHHPSSSTAPIHSDSSLSAFSLVYLNRFSELIRVPTPITRYTIRKGNESIDASLSTDVDPKASSLSAYAITKTDTSTSHSLFSQLYGGATTTFKPMRSASAMVDNDETNPSSTVLEPQSLHSAIAAFLHTPAHVLGNLAMVYPSFMDAFLVKRQRTE